MIKLESKVLPSNAEPENKNPAWLPAVIALGLGGLIIFEVWAYWSWLNLSLGPRVILQPWMLQNGFVPYEHIVDLHSPLMPMIIAALRQLEADGLKLAKLVLLSLITLTTVLTYITGTRKI